MYLFRSGWMIGPAAMPYRPSYVAFARDPIHADHVILIKTPAVVGFANHASQGVDRQIEVQLPLGVLIFVDHKRRYGCCFSLF
jgi:hypothetical protein